MSDDIWEALILSQQALTAAEETMLSLRAEVTRLHALIAAGHTHEWEASGIRDEEGDVLALCGRGDCHASTYWYGEADHADVHR